MKRDYSKDFPLLNDNKLIYFDNAATTQKPISVIEAVSRYYGQDNANPLRGLYKLAVTATDDYESARESVRKFINANRTEEIIFTRNTTESINLVAYSYGLEHINLGDEIVVSITEHHSDILPWQMVARVKGATLKYMYCDKEGFISDDEIHSKITEKTKLVAVGQVSNVLGMINPVEEIIKTAHSVGAVVLVDGAQSVPHMAVDVQSLGADFLTFSGHKMLAPMGIGVLYGKYGLLDMMQPFLTGGEMIDYVTEQSATFAELPHKFEAGTVNCSGAVGLAKAIEYINDIGFEEIHNQEAILTKRMFEGMKRLGFIDIYGADNYILHQGIISFNIKGVHPHDASTILDEADVCVRAGHHCAQPLLKHIGVSSTLRASLYFYNTEDEVDRFLEALSEVRRIMGYES